MARVKVLEDFSGKPAHMGAGAGKSSHWAYALDASGGKPPGRTVANDEVDVREALSGMPEGTLVVVDQRKNMGALVLRTARSLGFPVAYLPGKAEHDLASALPGVSKTDGRDAEAVALAARGVPSALRPVPEEDPALEGARALSALRAQCQKTSTAWKNALRLRLLEGCPASGRACDLSKPWCCALLAEALRGAREGRGRVRALRGLAGEGPGRRGGRPGRPRRFRTRRQPRLREPADHTRGRARPIDAGASDFPSEARPAGCCGAVPADRRSGAPSGAARRRGAATGASRTCPCSAAGPRRTPRGASATASGRAARAACPTRRPSRRPPGRG